MRFAGTNNFKKIKKIVIFVKNTGCGAVGSVLRSGRRGRAFESPYPDQKKRHRTNIPKFLNQHANRVLKTIALMAEIDVRLTYNIARHTHGTRLAEITQKSYLITQLMRHADIDTSMIYIHLSQERTNKQL